MRCFRIPGFAEECLALEVAVELVGKFNTDVGEDALGLSHRGSRSVIVVNSGCRGTTALQRRNPVSDGGIFIMFICEMPAINQVWYDEFMADYIPETGKMTGDEKQENN